MTSPSSPPGPGADQAGPERSGFERAGPEHAGFRAVIVRHGETSSNRDGIFRGLHDLPLDETGLEQARLVAAALAAGRPAGPVRAIRVSPLCRAVQTAEPFAAIYGLPLVRDERLRDVDVGRWQARPVAEVLVRDRELYEAWYRDPANFAFPGGESLAAVGRRALCCLGDLCLEHPGQTVALFTHRVPAKLLLAGALGAGPGIFWRLLVATASFSVVEFDGRRPVVTLLNSTAHLGGRGAAPLEVARPEA